jgi:hypothetical protein
MNATCEAPDEVLDIRPHVEPEATPMCDWNDMNARRQATRRFCEELHQPENAAQRARCKRDPAYARDLFARLGLFYKEEDAQPSGSSLTAIPRHTRFAIFDADEIVPRDLLVTLVLPRTDKPLPATKKIDPTEIWRCTYWPYAS